MHRAGALWFRRRGWWRREQEPGPGAEAVDHPLLLGESAYGLIVGDLMRRVLSALAIGAALQIYRSERDQPRGLLLEPNQSGRPDLELADIRGRSRLCVKLTKGQGKALKQPKCSLCEPDDCSLRFEGAVPIVAR